MAPSEQFSCSQEAYRGDQDDDDADRDSAEENDDDAEEGDPTLEALRGERVLDRQDSQPERQHFFVGPFEPVAEGIQPGQEARLPQQVQCAMDLVHQDPVSLADDWGVGSSSAPPPRSAACSAATVLVSSPPPLEPAPPTAGGIERFLQLPEIPVQPRRRRSQEQPLVDYSKNILVTSEEYLQAMELKAERKEQARKEAEHRKLEGEKKKEARVLEKHRKEEEKIQRARDARAREAFAQKWTTKAIREAGERLQWLVKNAPPQASGVEDRRFYGMLPRVCKENMARRLAIRRAAKSGERSAHLALPPNPPAWVQYCDPEFAVATELGADP